VLFQAWVNCASVVNEVDGYIGEKFPLHTRPSKLRWKKFPAKGEIRRENSALTIPSTFGFVFSFRRNCFQAAFTYDIRVPFCPRHKLPPAARPAASRQ